MNECVGYVNGFFLNFCYLVLVILMWKDILKY